jgi:O-antigen/teichoic acid export membrane protein
MELGGRAARLRHLSGSSPSILVLAISFNGLYATLSYWGNRRGRYGSLAIARVVQGAVGVAIPIISTRWFDSNGLVFGNAMNSLAAALFLLLALGPHEDGLFYPWDWARIRAVARRYANFPRVTVPHGLMDALQNNLVVLLIERFFGPTVLGLYSFSYRMLKAPLGLFGSALSQVFYRDAAESMVRRGSIEAEVKRVLKFLAQLAIPIFLLIVGIGSPFARQLFGAPWAGVGVTLQLLAPWILMNFLLSPLSQAPLILGRQGTWFLISLGDNLLIIGVVVLAGLAGWTSTAMLLALSLANVVYLGGALAWILAIARQARSDTRSDA